ncbi:Serine/threonine-protein kinase STY13 [Camellia lanceoleosa]|nr:Serine/threonine-protein kinase STY13 [Camellia lanceoleosa]
MEKSSDGFVRADQIDLKSLDEQLEKHLSRAWTMEKNKKKQPDSDSTTAEAATRQRQEWEIDPSKLIIKGVLARGTFGTVHRGVYDGQDVAVYRGNNGRFRAEHTNENGQIGMPSNICCVVVEYLPGGALKSYLIKNRRRKLAFKVVVQMALDLSRGLSYLHSQKIVHRDVKTENMLLDKTRTVKIADFGVARVEASNPSDMTGETGTLGYMAPEVLNGNPYNRKCDVYSFGICLWEMYCCDMPYPDLSFSEVTSAVVRQNLRPEIPRCCPGSLANVMKRCWDASPDKRPEMDEVVSMLEAIDTSKGGGMIPLDQNQGCLCFRKYRGP